MEAFAETDARLAIIEHDSRSKPFAGGLLEFAEPTEISGCNSTSLERFLAQAFQHGGQR